MNVIKFIQQHGVDKAREVVEGAPDGATYYVNEKSKIVVGLHGFYSDGFCVGIHNPHTHIKISDLKRLVESVDVVKQLDFWGRADVGIKKAKEVIKNNTLQASYYQPSSGCYYRYGRNSLYIVRDGEWREIYGGMDSNTLIHTDSLKQAIADFEAIHSLDIEKREFELGLAPDSDYVKINDMGDDSHIENHVSPNCKVGVK